MTPRRYFQNLPAELLERVSDFLQRTDIASLRLACRDIHTKTSSAFGNSYFQTVEVDFSVADIAWLQTLADNDKYCKSVRMFCVRPTHRTPETPCEDITDDLSVGLRRRLGLGYHWERDSAGCLLKDSPIIHTLCQMFKFRLSQCTSFRVCKCETDLFEDRWSTSSLSSADAVTILLRVISFTGLPVQSFELNSSFLHASRIEPAAWDCGELSSTWSQSMTNLTLSLPVYAQETD